MLRMVISNAGSEEADRTIRIVISKELILALAVIAICVAGAVIRLHPLADSDLPYHLDGVLESRYAEQITDTGGLEPEEGTSYAKTHTIYTPGYDALLALFASVSGEQPIEFVQLLVAPIAFCTILGCYVLGASLARNQKVGLIAGMAMAIYGPFLFMTQAPWKEILGIALLPIVFVTFYFRYDLRMRIFSSVLLVSMPLIHHLVAIIAILTIAIVSVASYAQARRNYTLSYLNVTDVLVTLICVNEILFYYSVIEFDRLQYLTPENGLYLFLVLVILISIGVYYIGERCITAKWRGFMILVAVGMAVLLLAVSLFAPIFTEESPNINLLSAPLVAVMVLVIMGIVGITMWASSNDPSKVTYFAILAAPFSLLAYAFLRAADLISHHILNRTLEFIDLGLMIGLGTFLVYELKGGERKHSVMILSLICILLLITVPIAVDPEEYLGVRNNLNEFELEGIEWAIDLDDESEIQTDRHFASVARDYFDAPEDPSIIRRIYGDLDFEKDTIMVASERWVTVGTNDYPFGWIQIEEDEFGELMENSSILYRGGPTGYELIVFIIPE